MVRERHGWLYQRGSEAKPELRRSEGASFVLRLQQRPELGLFLQLWTSSSYSNVHLQVYEYIQLFQHLLNHLIPHARSCLCASISGVLLHY